MRKIANKMIRDGLETSITDRFRKTLPHFEFEYRFRSLPLYPKIVLYSNIVSVDRFMERLFPTFRLINPKPSNESDEVLARQIATEIIKPSDADISKSGVIVQGFPFNSAQALLLDRFLNGVNLALHIKGTGGAQDFSSLLKYYDDRGTLVELDFKDNMTSEELATLQKKIIMSMKRAE